MPPSGTNLFTAAQAKDMFAALLADEGSLSWQGALNISDVPEVHETIVNFVDDATEDNAVEMTLAICKVYGKF